jgi:hypothetical protein
MTNGQIFIYLFFLFSKERKSECEKRWQTTRSISESEIDGKKNFDDEEEEEEEEEGGG